MADKEAGQDTAVHDDNRGQIEIENDRVSSCSPSEDGNVPISPLTPLDWIKIQMELGVKPAELLRELLGPTVTIPSDVDDGLLWETVLELMVRPPGRELRDDVTSLDHVIQLINDSKNIIVLSGAGISVSCGIPDFRSPDGLYARLAVEFPDLPDPQSMFDIKFFEIDPRPFFKFAKEIFPGNYEPSISHRFIKALEQRNKLLRNYTQNIDTLEKTAGINSVVYCHGSFSTATCRSCGHHIAIEDIKEQIINEEIPYCPVCVSRHASVSGEDDDSPPGVMKPDIVFFGEGLPSSFHTQLQKDKAEADLLIVMGSSLKVRPVSLIPELIPPHIPQVLINREPLNYMKGFDVRLLGYSDTVVSEICRRLGQDWVDEVKITDDSEKDITSPRSRIYLLEGGIWNPPSPTNSSLSDVGDIAANDLASDIDDIIRDTDDVTTSNISTKVARDRDLDNDDIPPLKLPRIDKTNMNLTKET